jgi:hypothetical protein
MDQHRARELAGDGLGVVAGQVLDGRADRQPGLAVHCVDGAVPGQGLAGSQLEPSFQAGGVGVLGGQPGEHHQWRALADREVGQAAVQRPFANAPATIGPDRAGRPDGSVPARRPAAERGHRPGQADAGGGQGRLDPVPA